MSLRPPLLCQPSVSHPPPSVLPREAGILLVKDPQSSAFLIQPENIRCVLIESVTEGRIPFKVGAHLIQREAK